MSKYWYAVVKNSNDKNLDCGSYSLKEAKYMVEELDNSDDAFIAVIDENNDGQICIATIEQSEFDNYGDEWYETRRWIF